MTALNKFYRFSFKPRSRNEDLARKELIFNLLLGGFIALAAVTFVVSLLRYVLISNSPYHMSSVVVGIVLVVSILFYCFSRIYFGTAVMFIFVASYLLIGTYTLYTYGYTVAQGILLYALVIIISGILISARASIVITCFIITCLALLHYMQTNNIIQTGSIGLKDRLDCGDLIICMTLFLTIFLVTWIYGHEVEQSVKRLRKNEKILKKERGMLEIKVKERTRELEQIQAEKTIELYKFAEFGQLNSSLVHDLANPLMAIAMNFDELANSSENTELIDQIREGIVSMGNYVDSARNDLNIQISPTAFDTKKEIRKVITLHQTKIRTNNINCLLNLKDNLSVRGDGIKFHQIISNLLCNAIDAISEKEGISHRTIHITSNHSKTKNMVIIKVQDNGIGIPADKLKTIFKPFYTTKDHAKGTGIGLNIVKRAVIDCGGNIIARSDKHKTVFIISLPIAKITT